MNALEEVHNFKMPEDELKGYVDRELETCIANLRKAAVECPGATKVCETMHQNKKYKMGTTLICGKDMPTVRSLTFAI